MATKYVGRNQVWRLSFLVVVGAVLLAGRSWAQVWSWSSQNVGRGITSSVAIDGSGNLHLTFITEDDKVYYAFRPATSDKWFTTRVIDSTHYSQNVFPRVAVDKGDRPHVCVAFGVLEYVTLDNHRWVTQEIDPGSGTISYHCSVAVDSAGTPHLSWYHEFWPGGKQFTHLRHASLENGAWVVRSVDGGVSGKWNSMVVDSKGFAHLAYSQWTAGGDLRYAAWDGKLWNVDSVDSSSNAGTYRGYDNSLVLAADGSPHISYFDDTTLKYAYRKDGKWTIEKVGEVAGGFDFYRGSTALLLDTHGVPHIIFGDVGGVKHAFWDGKQWQIQVIVSGAMEQYSNVDAAIGPDDTLYVSYPDPEDGFVKVLTGKATLTTQAAKK